MDKSPHRRPLVTTRSLQCYITEETHEIYYKSVATDPFENLQNQTITVTLEVFADTLKHWYSNTVIVTNTVVSDIKTFWIITSGNHLHKGKAVGKLLTQHLIVIGIYLIQCGFWINFHIIKIIITVIFENTSDSRNVLGILFSILMVLLLEATISAACND